MMFVRHLGFSLGFPPRLRNPPCPLGCQPNRMIEGVRPDIGAALFNVPLLGRPL